MNKRKKKIVILLGNPEKISYSGSIADAYEQGARDAKHEVQRFNLGDLTFDPILHKGYRAVQPLEPDLLAIQEAVKWADHLVIVYPNWWNTMPAILKGFFDRVWLPGFAFNFDKKTKRLIQRLKGKSARVIVSIGTQGPMSTWMEVGDFTNEVQHGILEFAGFHPVKVKCFGPVERCSDRDRLCWSKEAYELGKKGI